MMLLKTSSKGKSLLDALTSTPIGVEVDFQFGKLLSAFEEPVTAVMVETQLNKYWELRTYWHGIYIGTLVAEVKGANLELEVV